MCQKINRGCANSKYVTRNHHLEQELRDIFGSSNGFLCNTREKHAEFQLEFSHTGFTNLPQGQLTFLQIFIV